jgi:hypothetical protein
MTRASGCCEVGADLRVRPVTDMVAGIEHQRISIGNRRAVLPVATGAVVGAHGRAPHSVLPGSTPFGMSVRRANQLSGSNFDFASRIDRHGGRSLPVDW